MKACIVIDYFGKLPEYFKFFLKSCEYNPTFNWLIHTDDTYEGDIPPNVCIKYVSWEDYIVHISNTLLINFKPAVAYKICDLKPALGYIWKEELKDFDYWGFGDIDLIYGDLSIYFTQHALKNYPVNSVHGWNCSGPLCILWNTEEWQLKFSEVHDWADYFEEPHCVRFDEDIFLRGTDPRDPVLSDFNLRLNDCRITPLVKGLWDDQTEYVHDDMFIWKDGKITSPNNPGKEFLVVHFMNYEKARWMDDKYGGEAPWSKLLNVVNPNFTKDYNSFTVSLFGINPN